MFKNGAKMFKKKKEANYQSHSEFIELRKKMEKKTTSTKNCFIKKNEK